jgi:hypothetical protein
LGKKELGVYNFTGNVASDGSLIEKTALLYFNKLVFRESIGVFWGAIGIV